MEKTYLICLVLSIITIHVYTQETEIIDNEEAIYTIIEQLPSFPGGEEKMNEFIKSNLKYPDEAKSNRIQGTVYASFIITSSGKINNINILRGLGGGCDEETIRLIGSMPPWEPGKQRGKPVSVKFTLPVKFKL
jgi:periplasmic protein TonB